jgi:hypothetical protein
MENHARVCHRSRRTLSVCLCDQIDQSEAAGYTKSFKDLVADIGRLGDEKKQLEMIFNALYVVGINQSHFKDRIKKIYGSKQWPSYKELGAELHTYSLATKVSMI